MNPRLPVIESYSLGYFARWLNTFHIYAFTLVAGYLFAFKISMGEYNKFFSFLKNKARRLLLPYIFVALVWLIPISFFLLKKSSIKIINTYFLCVNPEQLWFLWMLFGVFVIVWPFRLLVLQNPVKGFMLALVLYGIGLAGAHVLPNIFCIWTACRYVLFFVIGMQIRTVHECKQECFTDNISWYAWLLIDLMLFLGMLYTSKQSGVTWRVFNIGINLLLHVTGSIMAFMVLQTLANQINWQDNKLFKILSSYSMPMYLFHQQFIYFAIIALNGVVAPWINATLNFIVAFMGSFLISAVLMQWNCTRVLIGENKMQIIRKTAE